MTSETASQTAPARSAAPGADPLPSDLETKSGFPLGVARYTRSRAPIAQVAGDAAAQSALETLAGEVESARREGRMVQALPLEAIEARHLVRDRLSFDDEELAALKTSMAARGQQTPIEVVELAPGRYGLISGLRRLMALTALQEETGEARFATIKALVHPARSMSDSYVAMVEENEIRANLSFYERAHLACEAARLGIYADARAAVQTLFSATSPARRSKILSFVRLHEAVGAQLRFPAAIPERLGLALIAAIEREEGFLRRLRDVLRKRAPDSAETERVLLERALRKTSALDLSPKATPPAPAPAATSDRPEADVVAPGITLQVGSGRATLSGPGVTEALLADLRDWLAQR